MHLLGKQYGSYPQNKNHLGYSIAIKFSGSPKVSNGTKGSRYPFSFNFLALSGLYILRLKQLQPNLLLCFLQHDIAQSINRLLIVIATVSITTYLGLKLILFNAVSYGQSVLKQCSISA